MLNSKKFNLKSSLSTFIGTVGLLGLVSAASAAPQVALPIVGGQNVDPTDQIAHTTVALYFVLDQGGALCTGSILDDSHILTAAHCVEGATKGVVIFLTSIDLHSSDSGSSIPQEALRPMTQVAKSADYPGANNSAGASEFHDLGLITFSGGLPAGYQPAKIITPAILASSVKKGGTAVIAGYGTTGTDGTGDGTLRKTTLPIDGVMARGIDVVVGSDGDVACHGDSGGPAYVNVDGQLYLWGVASRSNCTSFSIYTTYVQSEDVNGNIGASVQ